MKPGKVLAVPSIPQRGIESPIEIEVNPFRLQLTKNSQTFLDCQALKLMSRESLERLFAARNLQTRESWSNFAQHRQRIRTLIEVECPGEAKSICILGAGNTHDLDLPWLVARFEQIVLIDLDAAATRAGIALQLGGTSPQFLRTLCLDVTGVFARLDAIDPTSASELATLRQEIEHSTIFGQIGETFDFVLSTCLLSQLVDAVERVLREGHPEFVPMLQAIRTQHLKLVTELGRSKGVVAIVSDFVSSLTCPELPQVQEAHLPAYATELLRRRNFFTGLNPVVLREALAEQLSLVGRSVEVQLLTPWRWDLGPRQYLVTAAVARLP